MRADLASGRGAVGSACTASSECERNCLRDPAWPNGYCTTVQLDCRVAVDCPAGTICGDVNPPGNEICLKRCNVDGDCRTSEGYACCLHGAGAEVCVPLRFCR